MSHLSKVDPRHGWIITRDLISERFGDLHTDVGVTGPREADPVLIGVLEEGPTPPRYVTHQFRMYDDDGILYYKGTMLMPHSEEGDEDHLTAPLYDFGLPNAGCTRIEWDGHPEWEMG